MWALWALSVLTVGQAAISSMNYVPLGSNPTLYTPGFEPIMHLDQQTFADTVYGQDHAFVVEFYADWCGHCRAFAPYFRQFAGLVKEWSPVVTVAVMNCADAYNQQACRDNGVTHFPMLKYFPRSARSPQQAKDMETPHAPEQMRETVLRTVVNEYNLFRYHDWPQFIHLSVDSRTTYGQLWQGVAESADYMAILFEEFDGIGAQFLLDTASRSSVMGARRALSNSALVQMLRVREFPTVALFRRDHQQALYMQRFTNATYSDLDKVILSDSQNSFQNAPVQLLKNFHTTTTTTTAAPILDCQSFPDSCAQLYFVSETDMLKAVRMAIYDEVIRGDAPLRGENLTALTNFVTLLSQHFPVLSFSADRRVSSNKTTSSILKNSERARLVFNHMQYYLSHAAKRSPNSYVTVEDYKRQFDNVERVYAYPFPVNSTWQHCRGSSPMFRGYTCGLWTTFHALTVHTYIDTIKDDDVDAIGPLRNIQGWVKNFFGCTHCKNHFMHMTTSLYPLNERRVRHPHDMITYLWRAHNIVNNRLHGDATEDPQFIKYQFPTTWLCPNCQSNGQFSRRKVRNFMLRYYGSIRAHNHLKDRRLSFF